MDTIPWPMQDGVGLVKPSLIINTSSSSSSPSPSSSSTTRQVVEKKVRPHKERALHCPRCNSTNTKFCYYNNYSLTQPRYFCKGCRRYWTEGGTLRNVPIGGGSRKNKKHHSSSSSSSSFNNSRTIGSLPEALSRDANQNPKLSASHHGAVCNNSVINTSTWPIKGMDLMMRSPIVQVPMVESGVGTSANVGVQGLRSAMELGLDHGCYGYMQGMMMPLQEMGNYIPTSDLMFEMINHRGVGGGDQYSTPNGVWW